MEAGAQGATMDQHSTEDPGLARGPDEPSGDALSAAAQPTQAATDDPASLESADEPQPSFAGNSKLAGWPVPMPDPRNPVDYVALVMDQTVTDGLSAAPLYDAAGAAHVAFEGDYELYEAALHGDPDALSSPEITQWLQANQTALANYRAATQFDYRGQLTAVEGAGVMGILLPALSERRALARLSIVEAKRLEANGDVDAALDNYFNNFMVGRHMSQGPTLIENLVGMAIQQQTADSLLDSLASAAGQGIDYAQLAERTQCDYPPLRPVVEVFQGERICCLDLVQELYEWDPDTRDYAVTESGMQKVDWAFGDSMADGETPKAGPELRAAIETIGFEGMVAEVNQYYDRLTETALMPYQDAKQAWQDLEAGLNAPEYKQHNPLLARMLTALGRLNHLAARARATRNATRLIANLKAYNQQHGDYPESLEVFGDSDMTVDPFTGERFVYRRDDGDFTLYSLGGNGIDDGGAHGPRADTNDVLYWPRPARSK
jgi:hypothetical protein